FLHSVMIQEKRGMLKIWNMFLIIGSFSAVIFGTFATRSGLVESVHSFARSSIGFPMFLFWFSVTFVSVALILWRQRQGMLKDEHGFTNLLSRESLFVLNNLVFVALFVAVFWGSFGAPIVSELFLDTNITLGTDYFQRVTPPLFILLYVLMGVAPVSAWGASSLSRLGRSLLIPALLTVATLVVVYLTGIHTIGALVGYGVVVLAGWTAIHETFRGYRARQRTHNESPLGSLRALASRNPRRYGGYMIHLGVTVIGIGVIGSTLFQAETQQTLAVGDTLSLNGYEMHYNRLDTGQITTDGRVMDVATVTVSRDGHELATLRPRRDFFPEGDDMNTMTIAGAYSTLENDFYVLLVGWEDISSQSATFKVYINPLINLIWWGGIILIIGTLIAAWPNAVLPARAKARMRSTGPGLIPAKGSVRS
ncbi:MAG: heme lyase CcmF/NrfE family subunit, partial [Anaerolineae bacterium]|nr:heme lyase CcmF/NrfE family subunit [Anaerolineae bacterium]